MARFERGKGKKRTGWDISQFGEVLRTHDQPSAGNYLPGYRRFRNAAQAYTELQRLVAEQLKQGFEPVDEAAQKFAADLPVTAKLSDQPMQLPLRRDLSVYNEATGFCITSGKMAGKGIESGEPKWDKAVRDGKVIPIGLIQDDPFNVRVVAGDALSEQEMAEWVGRVDWHLDLSDGQLVICGGAEYLMDDYEEGDSYADQFVATLPVPPGHYRATAYFQLNGVNGKACLDELAGGYDRMEAPGLWFRRTRPDTPFPAWLRYWCVGSPSDDPGHEAEWQGLPYPEHGPDYIDFLLHLQPDATPAETKKILGKPATESGWFAETAGARKPELCPLGLEAYNLLARKEPVAAGGWIYLHDLLGTVTTKLFPLKEDLVLPLESIADVFTLAWFAHTHTRPELRVTPPSGQIFDAGTTWPEQVMAWQEGDILRIGFGNDLYGQAIIDTLDALAPKLAALPAEAVLELFCSQVQYEGDNPKAGLQRYRGKVTEQGWQIDAVYPAVKPAQINAALELARECRNGVSLRVQDEAEAKSILAWLRANYGPYAIEHNPPRYADNALRLKKSEVGLLRLLASAAFAVRYRKIWPVMNRGGDDGQDDKEPTAASQEIAMPIKGAKILELPSGRIYMQTLALMLSEALAERIQKEEKALRKLGFNHVADIVCSQFDNIAIRGYADAGNDTWATFLIASPDTLVLEFSTRFEKSQASLLTTQQANQIDDAASHTFRQSLPTATFEEMFAAHKQRKEALMAENGAPLSFARGIKSLAEAVEAALAKQLGG